MSEFNPQLLKRHFRLMATAYGVIGLLAVIAMVVNVKTVPVNENIQTTKRKYQIVREDNERRKLELAQTLTLRTVEHRATTELGMTYPSSFLYIDRNGHVLDKNGLQMPTQEPASE